MRVAIDARELLGEPTGVGRYLRGVTGAWSCMPDARQHQFVLCAPGPIPDPPEAAVTMIAPGRNAASAGTAWEQLTLPALVRRSQADVLFAPAYTCPLRAGVPVVLAVHDVSYFARPEWFGWREGVRRRTLVRLSARRARTILTISEYSKEEIASHLGVARSRIAVVYPGATALAPPSGRPREDLVLYVGSLFARRHIAELIRGFARVMTPRAEALRLEIVGDNRTAPRVDFAHVAAASGAGSRVSLRSYVPDPVLADLYGRARAFVFLSEYEGFGLTPVEALASGVPLVLLDTPVAREVCGDAAVYVAKPEPGLIGAALERVLFDEAERERILAAARRILPRYSWERCARGVLSALAEAAGGGGRTP